jgi:Ca2+-binding EF-hand superfamily protein
MKTRNAFFSALLGVAAVTAAEIPTRGPIPFPTWDRNGDGRISPSEFEAVQAQRMSSRAHRGGSGRMPGFSFFDVNGDGGITPDELAAGQQKRRSMGGKRSDPGHSMPAFADFDTNGDGKLLEQEFYQARNKRIGERAKAGYLMRNLGKAPSFQDLDTYGNGEVTPEEFAAHRSRHQQQMLKR